MKKFFVAVAAVVVALSAVGCSGSGRGGELDSLSYAIGADMGYQLKFGMSDLNLDRDIVIENLRDFYKSGDVDSEEFKQNNQRMMEFQYTRFFPYMQAKMQRDYTATDMPDTLPALPELYNEEFTREFVSSFMGQSMGASLKGIDAKLSLNSVEMAIRDIAAIEHADSVDGNIRMTMDEMQRVVKSYTDQQRAKEEAERTKALTENAEASAAWLLDVEKMEGVKKTESGLLYRIDREGTGAQATADSDIVEVNYEGKTRTGKIFDSSYERGESISFGLNRVIKGWTEGLKLVKEGGQITLWIPAELAYGERGAGENIGPNEALEFKVELIKVTK